MIDNGPRGCTYVKTWGGNIAFYVGLSWKEFYYIVNCTLFIVLPPHCLALRILYNLIRTPGCFPACLPYLPSTQHSGYLACHTCHPPSIPATWPAIPAIHPAFLLLGLPYLPSIQHSCYLACHTCHPPSIPATLPAIPAIHPAFLLLGLPYLPSTQHSCYLACHT